KKKKEVRSTRKHKKNRERFTHLRSAIESLLGENAGRGLSLKQIIRRLGVKKKEDIKKTGDFLDQLEDQHKISRLDNGQYVSNRSQETYTGRVDHVSSRFAYVQIEGDEELEVY